MPDRLTNPFIIGAPTSASKFIGRKEQVNTIISQLVNPESRGSSAISGGRRIGKTSLLHYIASPEAAERYNLPPDQFVFVSVDGHTLDNYVSSLGQQTFTEDVFWHYVAQCLAYLPQFASLLAPRSRIPGFKWLMGALERFVQLREQSKIGIFDLIKLSEQIAADGKLAVLLLDEFEWITNNTEPQRPTLLNTLRSLINLPIGRRGFALITSSEEPLSALCKDIEFSGSPFPNSLVPVHLRPFSPPEAYELIDEYLKDTAVAFSAADKDFAYDLSEGHPYWLQRVCFTICNRYLEKAEDNSVQGTQITIALNASGYEEIKDEIMAERGLASIPSLREKKKEKERESQPSPKTDLPLKSRKFKIYVSSTLLDLQLERHAVEEALHRMCSVLFAEMEYSCSRPETPKEARLKEISCSDVYVGIFAHRYGHIDPESGLSITELEYRKARECNIQCLIYMMDESEQVPDHTWQEREAVAKLKALKQDLMRKHVVSFFTSPDNLATQVMVNLTSSPPLSIHKLATLIRDRCRAGDRPYTLLLGSSLSLTPTVRQAACGSNDWGAFWTAIQGLSAAERRALLASLLASLNLVAGYRCLAELAQAGCFSIILTANIDDALDDALRILPASECKVLCHGQTSAHEIAEAISRPMPRVKAIKLRGDINAYKLPLTPESQFEFPKELGEVVEQLLSQDTILVGDISSDNDIQRCIPEGDNALWVVVPEEPRPASFLYKAKRARPKGEIITGPRAEFGFFFRTLAEALGLHKTVPLDAPDVL